PSACGRGQGGRPYPRCATACSSRSSPPRSCSPDPPRSPTACGASTRSSGTFYLAAVELGDQAAREFAAHAVAVERLHPQPAAQADAPELPALDAEDFDVGENHGRILLVLAQRGADLAHRGAGRLDVLVTLDRRVDRHISVASRSVADHLDLAVRNEVHVAVAVAQAYVAQRDLLDLAGFVQDLDHVTLAELVLDQEDEAGEVVLDQALGAEPDRHARDAGRGEDRRHGDAELA